MTAKRVVSILGVHVLAISMCGCQEPGYRNEVSTNSQGAVEVHRVAKDPFPDSSAAAPTTQPDSATEQRIAALEAQVLELKAEVGRLNSATGSHATPAP